MSLVGHRDPQPRDRESARDELVEVITQLAFYAGWPNAITALTVAREVVAGPER